MNTDQRVHFGWDLARSQTKPAKGSSRGDLIKFIRDPRHDPIRILGAVVAYFRKSAVPNAMRIADIIDDAITAELARLSGQLPMTAIEAIAFAIERIDDHYERLEFLQDWQHGRWDVLRDEWPEAFSQAPARAIEAPATTGHPESEKRASDHLCEPPAAAS